MAKILFTQNNSQWGIITNPVAGNVFRHTIDFPDATDEASFITLRNQFINEQLFDTVETFQELFTSIKDQAFTRLNETQIEFNFALDSDPLSRDFKEIMNSDYMILEYLIGEVKHYEFYAIIPQDRAGTDNGVFVFKGELDIFLSFYITYRNQNQIKRMHTDRYDSNLKYLNENNLIIESDLEAIEPDFVEDTSQITFLESNNPQNTRSIKWMIIYQKINNNTGTAFTTAHAENGDENLIELGYRIYITPILNKDFPALTPQAYYFDSNSGNVLGNTTYNLFYDDAVTLSIHYLSNPPFTNEILTANFGAPVNNVIPVNFIKGTEFDNHLEYDPMKQAFFIKDLTSFPYSPDSISPLIFNKPVLTNFNQSKEILNEAKLQFSQFTKYNIKTVSGEYGELPLEFISDDNNENILRFQYGFQPDKFTVLVYFPNQLGSRNRFEKYGAITTDILELPLATDPWEEYVTNNRVTSKTSLLVPTVGIGVGGISKLRPSQQSPALFLGAGKLLSNLSAKGDIKNQPIEPKNVTNSFQLDWLNNDDKVYIEQKVLENSYKNLVFDYLYKLGYEVNILKNIDDIKISRYYFNHIEALDVFSNINGKLSSVIKQLIDESFKNGITFWHYRDESTWNGINSYTLENQEMNLVLVKSTKKVQDENPNK